MAFLANVLANSMTTSFASLALSGWFHAMCWQTIMSSVVTLPRPFDHARAFMAMSIWPMRRCEGWKPLPPHLSCASVMVSWTVPGTMTRRTSSRIFPASASVRRGASERSSVRPPAW